MTERRKKMLRKFDPKHPTCMNCGKRLLKENEKFTLRYDDIGATTHGVFCPCGAMNSYVVMDDPNQNVDYIVKKIK